MAQISWILVTVVIIVFTIAFFIASVYFIISFYKKLLQGQNKNSNDTDMSKCKNCGANIEGLKCQYCGAKTPEPDQSTNMGFLGSFYENINRNIQAMQSQIPTNEEERKALREKNRLARLAIDNKKCPECGVDFKTIVGQPISISCKKCGALLDKTKYIDLF